MAIAKEMNMRSTNVTLPIAAAVLGLALGCSPRENEPTGAPGTSTGRSSNDGAASGPQAPSGGTTSGSSTRGTNSSQGASGEGTPVSPPGSAASF